MKLEFKFYLIGINSLHIFQELPTRQEIPLQERVNRGMERHALKMTRWMLAEELVVASPIVTVRVVPLFAQKRDIVKITTLHPE